MIKSILVCCMLFCAGGVLGQTAALKYKGGTYSFGEADGRGVSGSVRIRPINAEKALFQITMEGREPSYDLGFITGVMKINGTVGVAEKKDNDVTDFKLQFVFKADQLTVTTLDGRNAYGYSFGVDGMHPNHVYKLTNTYIPQQYVSDEGSLIPFIEAYVSMIDPDYYYTPKGNALWDSGQVKSGSTVAKNQIWYKNDSLNQVTVSTDYGTGEFEVWMHFYKDQIPDDLIKNMVLFQENGDTAILAQKMKDVAGFVDQAVDVENSSADFFESVQGVKLGDPKSKAITMYGNPDEETNAGGYERLDWHFVGIDFFFPSLDAPDTKLASDCADFSVTQYYKDGRLVAQITNEMDF